MNEKCNLCGERIVWEGKYWNHRDTKPRHIVPNDPPTVERSEFSDWLDAASPMPWRIDKDNSEGIEVVDAVGDLVYIEDYGSFPDEMRSSQVDSIISKIRANAYLMVEWSKGI